MLKNRWQTTWRKWFRAHGSGEAAEIRIHRGDRFYSRSQAHHIWVVERVYTPPGQQLPHARVFRLDDRKDCRLWAQGSLLNPADFAPDRRRIQQGKPEEFARRKLDKPQGNARRRPEVRAPVLVWPRQSREKFSSEKISPGNFSKENISSRK